MRNFPLRTALSSVTVAGKLHGKIPMKLADKVILVTGSSQGIGAGIALRLAQEGADIVLNYHSHPEEADAVKAQITALGRRAVSVGADLSTVAGVTKLIGDGVAGLGRIDILVNNAGVEKNASFWDVAETDYDLVLNTNLKGPFFATQAFVKHLQGRNAGGKIINISSVHEELPFPHFTSYCASKGGLKMMMRNLSIELAPLGITINNVAPGAIETPINTKLLNDPEKLKALLANIPLNRLGKPADVAGAVAFLASSDADYITGTTLVVDGGLTWDYSEQ
jgi:glucose 1-dehydrogenase